MRSLRQDRGLSLAELARLLGVTVSVVSELERGKGWAVAGVAEQVATQYGLPIEEVAALCPLPAGLVSLLARADVSFSEAQIVRLCRLEFRGGEDLSADDWLGLAKQLTLADS